LTELGLDLAAVRGPILAPGLGAQGATAADLRRTFGAAYGQVLGTSSRDILGAGPRTQDLYDAARRTLEELRTA
jgi:orotidine-5'-phosphate decarboxylase